MIGQIRKIDADKNWGFIKPDSSGQEDHFFHASSCNREFDQLKLDFLQGANIRVEFESIDSPKGKRAENVRRIEL